MPTLAFQVQVEPSYLPEQSSPARGLYGFAYTVHITNTGSAPAQLIARHWVITDDLGHTEEVKGLGVIGRQPLLQPGESFEYTSGCQLRTPSGTMHGSFLCVSEQGEVFSCPIPRFMLQALGPQDAIPSPSSRVLH